MKPLYLLDECCNEKKHIEIEQFAKSTDIIGTGATDEEVFELAKKMKIPVITCDIRFALRMLIKNYPVVLRFDGKTVYMKPDSKEDVSLSDSITYYLHNTDSIVIP